MFSGTPIRIALWSGDYAQVTGQALVTARVANYQPRIRWSKYVYKGSGVRSVTSWLTAALSLWVAIARGQLTTVYLVCSRSNWGFLRDLPVLLTAMSGIRVVVHSHGSDIVDLLTARRLSPIARALYKRCEIVVPSAHLLEPLRNVTSMPLHLCENYFMSVASGITQTPPVHCDPEMLTVLWNSNIMGSKGFFFVVEAVRGMWEEGLAVRLVSIGKPIGDEDLSEETVRNRLALLRSMIWFDYRGHVDPETASSLVACADVVTLPSYYRCECQPLAIIQAMCAGKAIVVSDIPALRETLGDYPAHFVPIGSVSAILDALRQVNHEKKSDAVAFVSSRYTDAAGAQKRFDVNRFDQEMTAILIGTADRNH